MAHHHLSYSDELGCASRVYVESTWIQPLLHCGRRQCSPRAGVGSINWLIPHDLISDRQSASSRFKMVARLKRSLRKSKLKNSNVSNRFVDGFRVLRLVDSNQDVNCDDNNHHNYQYLLKKTQNPKDLGEELLCSSPFCNMLNSVGHGIGTSSGEDCLHVFLTRRKKCAWFSTDVNFPEWFGLFGFHIVPRTMWWKKNPEHEDWFHMIWLQSQRSALLF